MIPIECYKRVYGPGDEFHANPFVTALIGLHCNWTFGQACSGNQRVGIVSIRCGLDDIIRDNNTVIWSSKSSKNIIAFTKVYEEKSLVRVLLQAEVPYPFRRNQNTQY